ncbi:MAG: hypothetical protein WCP52_08155 [Bacteroidota bacterium]
MGRRKEFRNLLADEIEAVILSKIANVNCGMADEMEDKVSAAARVIAKECFKLYELTKPNEKAFRKKLAKQLVIDKTTKKKKELIIDP